MFRTLVVALALLLFGSASPAEAQKPPQPRSVPVSISQVPASEGITYDADAERQLLLMANQARAKAGLPALESDEGLTQAARVHGELMAARQQLSHQFDHELYLTQRIAATSALHLDSAGENVAFGGDVQQVESGLMHSPHHRENLLNASYNVAGFGVVRSGYALYVVQDFGHSLRSVSADESTDLIADSIEKARRSANLPALRRQSDGTAAGTACKMAQADSLNVPTLPGQYILRYTSMQPDVLPAAGIKAINDSRIHAFSAGTCYARTSTYPNGVYWVALLLYF